jgi:HK97 family phage major capsid protein
MADIIQQTASLSEVRSELKSRIEQAKLIEDRYPGEITNQEDYEQVKKLLGEADSLAARATALEEKAGRQNYYTNTLTDLSRPANGSNRPNPTPGEMHKGQPLSPGDQFVNDRGYRELLNRGHFKSRLALTQLAVTLEDGTSLVVYGHAARQKKDLVYSGGSDIADPVRVPQVIDIRQRELTVLDLITRIPTSSDTVEYVREDTFTNSAAAVAEASATTGTSGLKPESVLVYSVQTSPVSTIAHWIPVTNQMLADTPAIRAYINGRLMLGLDMELEDLIIAGDGNAPNLRGILNTSGINIQGKGTDNEVDAIFKARTQVRVNGKLRPNAVVLHPNDWQAIRLMRENVASATLGNYLMGPPSQVGAMTLWGLPVVESEGITENTGLVGDFNTAAALYDREQAAIRVGTIDDQFVRNMQTILAELRAAFIVYRPAGFTKVTGI